MVIKRRLGQHLWPGLCLGRGGALRVPRGFTLTELIVVIVIVGALAIAVLPRFVDQKTFSALSYYDQVLAAVRYAQKVAVAQNKTTGIYVLVNSTSVRVCQDSACATAVTNPTTNSAMTLTTPSGVSIASSTSPFSFNALGQPSTGPITVTITAAGEPARTFTVEKETGYVHP